MAAYIAGTGSGAFFSEQLAALQSRLEGDESPRALALAAEAKRLSALFETWLTERPEPELKAAAIRELFDLNRAVLEHVGATSGLRDHADDATHGD